MRFQSCIMQPLQSPAISSFHQYARCHLEDIFFVSIVSLHISQPSLSLPLAYFPVFQIIFLRQVSLTYLWVGLSIISLDGLQFRCQLQLLKSLPCCVRLYYIQFNDGRASCLLQYEDFSFRSPTTMVLLLDQPGHCFPISSFC